MNTTMNDVVIVTEVMEVECEQCGDIEGVAYEPSDTAYCGPDGRYDPELNKGNWLCRGCAKEYHDYWKERWDEYRNGLM